MEDRRLRPGEQFPKEQWEAALRIVRASERMSGVVRAVDMDDFLQRLHAQGWSRGRIYRLLLELLSSAEGDCLDEDSSSFLDGVITAMEGNVHSSLIIRFPGEPSDQGDFLNYVCAYDRWMYDD